MWDLDPTQIQESYTRKKIQKMHGKLQTKKNLLQDSKGNPYKVHMDKATSLINKKPWMKVSSASVNKG